MAVRPIDLGTRNASDGDFLPLIACLEEQVDAAVRLLEVARAKQRAILDGDHKSLETAVAQEGPIVDHLSALEDRRSQWVTQWAARHSLSPDLTLKELIEKMPPRRERAAATLRALSADLSRVLNDLRDANELNAGLLYHSLAFTRMILGAFAESDPRSGTYGPGAAKQDDTPPAGTKAILEWRA